MVVAVSLCLPFDYFGCCSCSLRVKVYMNGCRRGLMSGGKIKRTFSRVSLQNACGKKHETFFAHARRRAETLSLSFFLEPNTEQLCNSVETARFFWRYKYLYDKRQNTPINRGSRYFIITVVTTNVTATSRANTGLISPSTRLAPLLCPRAARA